MQANQRYRDGSSGYCCLWASIFTVNRALDEPDFNLNPDIPQFAVFAFAIFSV